jgi:hypothetical protein
MQLTTDELSDKAHLALDKFVEKGGAYFGDNTDEKLVDLLSALRHLSDRYGFNWSRLLIKADKLYDGDKSP